MKFASCVLSFFLSDPVDEVLGILLWDPVYLVGTLNIHFVVRSYRSWIFKFFCLEIMGILDPVDLGSCGSWILDVYFIVGSCRSWIFIFYFCDGILEILDPKFLFGIEILEILDPDKSFCHGTL